MLTATAFLIRALRCGAVIMDRLAAAGQLAGSGAGPRWREAAAALVHRVNARCLNPERDAYVVGEAYSQTANAVALEFGLVPADAVAAVAARLAADVEGRGGHHHVGCIGAATLLKALSHHGYGALAMRVATVRSYPGWGFWFERGADTMWEMWEETSRSRDHYFHGTVVQWLIEDVVGLTGADDGWSTFDVAPCFLQPSHDGPKRAAFELETVRGRVAVAWRRAGDRAEVELEVPPGATARVTLPWLTTSLAAGRWTIDEDGTFRAGD